jgi:excisionase family DNA binding protein
MTRGGEPTEHRERKARVEVPGQVTLLTIQQVAEILAIGKTKAYALCREGIPVIRVGRALRVSPIRLQEWIDLHERRT